MSEIPVFDDAGINLADPNDARGLKTAYISDLQIKALQRIVGAVGGVAADVGCGYGRMTSRLASLGFDRVIGIDPSERVIDAARALSPDIEFRVGGLPSLPLDEGEVNLIFVLNVLRTLHLLGRLDIAMGIGSRLPKGGRVVVLDNLRSAHLDYIDEARIVELFTAEGLKLSSRHAIRGARWPWVPFIKAGMVPKWTFPLLINFELWLMSCLPRPTSWHYINVVWMFEKMK